MGIHIQLRHHLPPAWPCRTCRDRLAVARCIPAAVHRGARRGGAAVGGEDAERWEDPGREVVKGWLRWVVLPWYNTMVG